MGTYVNPGTRNMEIDIDDAFYVDKSMLIRVLNNKVNKKDRFICVSRPRRFGKTMAANMIAAYYSKGRDSHELFSNLKVSKDPSYEDNINKYTSESLEDRRDRLWSELDNTKETMNGLRSTPVVIGNIYSDTIFKITDVSKGFSTKQEESVKDIDYKKIVKVKNKIERAIKYVTSKFE